MSSSNGKSTAANSQSVATSTQRSQVPAGVLHHLSLSVGNMEKSVPFYKLLCVDIMGFAELHNMAEHAMWWKYGAGAIGISPGTTAAHNKFNPGLHHIAFNLESREQVDAAFQKLETFYAAHAGQEMGQILDSPAEYQYMPGYYAVFCTDPDGIKVELVHTPPSAYP